MLDLRSNRGFPYGVAVALTLGVGEGEGEGGFTRRQKGHPRGALAVVAGDALDVGLGLPEGLGLGVGEGAGVGFGAAYSVRLRFV